MFPRGDLERRPSKPRKVLLVGANAGNREDIATLLSTLGCTCTAVSGEVDALAAIQREPFEAVLLDLGHSGELLERTFLGIRKTVPRLAERAVVISSGAADRQAQELIELYDLPHLLREKLVSQLWNVLEDIFFSSGLRRITPKNIPKARLLFDSLRMPVPAGVRGTHTSGRHFTYEHSNKIIDVLIDCPASSNRVSLVGQVLDASRAQRKNDGLSVVLLDDDGGTLARTVTNPLGEFNLEFEFTDKISLEIRLGERSWVSIPLGHMDWLKKQFPPPQTGT